MEGFLLLFFLLECFGFVIPNYVCNWCTFINLQKKISGSFAALVLTRTFPSSKIPPSQKIVARQNKNETKETGWQVQTKNGLLYYRGIDFLGRVERYIKTKIQRGLIPFFDFVFCLNCSSVIG